MAAQRVNYFSVIDDFKNGRSCAEIARRNGCTESHIKKIVRTWTYAQNGNVEAMISLRRVAPSLADWGSQFLPEQGQADYSKTPSVKRRASSSSYPVINRQVVDSLALELINKTLATWLSPDQGDLGEDDKLYIGGIVQGINAMADAIREKLTESKGVEG